MSNVITMSIAGKIVTVESGKRGVGVTTGKSRLLSSLGCDPCCYPWPCYDWCCCPEVEGECPPAVKFSWDWAFQAEDGDENVTHQAVASMDQIVVPRVVYDPDCDGGYYVNFRFLDGGEDPVETTVPFGWAWHDGWSSPSTRNLEAYRAEFEYYCFPENGGPERSIFVATVVPYYWYGSAWVALDNYFGAFTNCGSAFFEFDAASDSFGASCGSVGYNAFRSCVLEPAPPDQCCGYNSNMLATITVNTHDLIVAASGI